MKKCWRHLYYFWQNTRTWRTEKRRDRQTDWDTAWRHRPRLCIASRGKSPNERQCRQLTVYIEISRSILHPGCIPGVPSGKSGTHRGCFKAVWWWSYVDVVNPLEFNGNYCIVIWMILCWSTGRWWVGCYICYSEEGTGRGRSPPRPPINDQCTNHRIVV